MDIGLDTETTGLTLHHGCLPFFVSMCDDQGTLRYWSWDVNPKTRTPKIIKKDIKSIEEILHSADKIILHNAKFDVRALEKAGITWKWWGKTHDTMLLAHIHKSNNILRLKSLAMQYCGIPDDDEHDLHEAIVKARNIGRQLQWRIADANDPHWPGMKKPSKSRDREDSWTGCDMWLPATIAKFQKYAPDHPWHNVLIRYALRDAERTLVLFKTLYEEILKKNNLQYQRKRKTLEPLYKMEKHGMSVNLSNAKKIHKTYSANSISSEKICYNLADNHIDNLRSPKQLQRVLQHRFNLVIEKKTKTGFSTEAKELKAALDQLPPRSNSYHFLKHLLAYRQQSTAVNYLTGYLEKSLPHPKHTSHSLLHPNYNAVGTDTTRLSSNDPNGQNISEKEGFNLRYAFGPLPGEEWYSLDYNNIEMRIFAFCSGDQQLIKAFLDGKSVHMVIAEVLWPELIQKMGYDGFKDKAQEYKWTKNGNFSLIYGASQRKADATYHQHGAYKRIRSSLPEIDRFMSEKNLEARNQGCVTTLGGYPLCVPKNGPHKAVNYFCQGSAGDAMTLALSRIYNWIKRERLPIKMIASVHDELLFAMKISNENKEYIKIIKELMESSGDTLGLPTPVEAKRIVNNWSEESRFDLAS